MQQYVEDNLATYTEERLQHDLMLLPEWRREQAMRFKHFEGRRNCTLAYLLFRHAMNERYPGIADADIPPFAYGEHGKPLLPPPFQDTHFSLTHCHEAVACVMASHPCGIDVESIGRYRDSVARYAMSDDELRLIHDSSHPALAFTRLWTKKEAYLKAIGTGIQDNMKNLSPEILNAYTITEEHTGKGYVLSRCLLAPQT